MIKLTITDIENVYIDDSENIAYLLKIMHPQKELEDLIRLERISEEEMIHSVQEYIELGYEIFSDCFRGKSEDSLFYLYVQTMIKFKPET